MSKFEKSIQRILTLPKYYTYTEARQLLTQLSFVEYTKGKTSGSRVKFFRAADQRVILLHKPHPGDVMTRSAVRYLVETLKRTGDLS